MIQTFNIVKQIDNIDPSNYFQLAAEQHNIATRQARVVVRAENPNENVAVPTINLTKPKGNKDPRKYFFTHHVVDSWNKLDQQVRLEYATRTLRTRLIFGHFRPGLGSWGAKNPLATIRWVEKVPEGPNPARWVGPHLVLTIRTRQTRLRLG